MSFLLQDARTIPGRAGSNKMVMNGLDAIHSVTVPSPIIT
jgi:hypothetical protein